MDFACLKCGYDLQGQLEAGVWECTECGHPIDPIERRAVWAERRLRRRCLLLGLGAPVAGTGLLVLLVYAGTGGDLVVLVPGAGFVAGAVGLFGRLRLAFGRRPVWKHDPSLLPLALAGAGVLTITLFAAWYLALLGLWR